MNITIKQREIQAALLNYIAQQGITLADKEVTITFTAGRKEAGITAEISIEDAAMPEIIEEDAGVYKTLAEVLPMVAAAVEPVVSDEPIEAEGSPEPVKTNSLFG